MENSDLKSTEIEATKVLPKHIAIIMDGNGRWAKKRMLPRNYGHKAGVDAVTRTVQYALKLGISYLTFYAFSTENWKRSDEEVDGLFDLFRKYLNSLHARSMKSGVKINILGDYKAFPEDLVSACQEVMEKTKENKSMVLNIALNYGGRSDIIRAIKRMQGKNMEITEENLSACLDTGGQIDPDLMIRTSGEMRLSNFLLYQLAYTELYFTDVLWPDFNEREMDKAIEFYAGRNRRFGGVVK